ncbi:MAG TPA: hypothetical protein VOA41_14365 [Candidatus Dormibacteraeota bacterium]|nr:hypothetical protein [Candidatus Dormibacteraeota bacterium]
MKKMSAVAVFMLSLLMLPGLTLADTLVLRNGTRVPGLLVKRTSSTITFRNSRGVVRRYRASDVEDVEISSRRQNTSGSPDTYDNANDTNSNPDNNRNNSSYQKNSATRGGDGQTELLRAGTQLEILTNETINSKQASSNQLFAAQVNQDVVDSSGEVIVPKGSPAQLIIRSLNTGGTNGAPELSLDIQSITVHGRRYAVTTSNVQRKGRSGIGANKRTAEMVGGGAVIGTIIGAIAGGGKGAAIGAAVGAAGGAGAQVLTKGKEVVIPAETVLKFNLEQSVTLAPEP